MEKPKPTFPHQLNSSQVLFRFVFRIVLLSALATLGTRGFGTTFATLLALSAIFCAVVGAMRREAMFGPVLTHWDEAASLRRHWLASALWLGQHLGSSSCDPHGPGQSRLLSARMISALTAMLMSTRLPSTRARRAGLCGHPLLEEVGLPFLSNSLREHDLISIRCGRDVRRMK